jgi:hypothetical protein
LLILFGTRGTVRTLAMITFICNNTNQPAAHRLSKITRWFTLFFVPVFPISRRHVLTCAACGQSSRITNEQAAEMVARVEAPQQESLPNQTL